MNVLSLFDGMSCGQLALRRAGISVNRYYASEIDKHAIKVAMSNFPDTVQLGDVRGIKAEDLPDIDLLIGGSPCQGFSFTGKRLNFDDPRSALFFEYVRVLNEVKPKYFLLENVKMSKAHQRVISDILGVEPVYINSSLVSAQVRPRLYWTNIPNVTQPEDRGITLRDIIDPLSPDNGTITQDRIRELITDRIRWGNHFGALNIHNVDPSFITALSERRWSRGVETEKSPTLLAIGKCDVLILMDLGRRLSITECELLQTLPKQYTAAATPHQRYRMIGNGWTVDVIAHIFGGMLHDDESRLDYAGRREIDYVLRQSIQSE